VPYLRALELCSQQGAIQIYVYLYLTFTLLQLENSLPLCQCTLIDFESYYKFPYVMRRFRIHCDLFPRLVGVQTPWLILG